MCAASQQIDVIPNQGQDGIGAGNLGLMCAHGKLFHFLFFSQLKGFDEDSLDENLWEQKNWQNKKLFCFLYKLVI